jgi:magnesium transporter
MPHFRKRYHTPGTSPGTLAPSSAEHAGPVTIDVIHYTATEIDEKTFTTAEEVFPYRDAAGVSWINVNGLHDVDLLQKLGEHFQLHPLALEDVVNTGQRPKIEDYDLQEFIVLKQLHYDGRITTEQTCLFLAKNYVITIQEDPGDCFEPIRERLRKGSGRLRKMGTDYLAYAFIDALVDQAFPILEQVGERIETLEEEVLANPVRATLGAIREVKHDLLQLRRAAWPQREVIHTMQREESRFVKKETRVYLRDLYDHTIQILDIIETYRDLTAGMLDIYLSSLSNRMNEIMKVLTIISTIFIPLTFLVGVYGMNFSPDAGPWSMPELRSPYGYVTLWGVMGAIALAMLWFFHRKKWI